MSRDDVTITTAAAPCPRLLELCLERPVGDAIELLRGPEVLEAEPGPVTGGTQMDTGSKLNNLVRLIKRLLCLSRVSWMVF